MSDRRPQRWQDRSMTDSGRTNSDGDDLDQSGASAPPPIPPLANDGALRGDDTLDGPDAPGAAGAGADPTLVTPVTAVGGAGIGGAVPPTGPGGTGPQPPAGGGEPPSGGVPPWLIPALSGGLVVGLLVVLGFMFLGGDDDTVTSGVTSTTIAPVTDDTVVTSEPAVDTTVPAEPSTTLAAEPTTTVVPETTTAPDRSVAPDTTAAPAPPTTLSPNGIPVASEGFVRVLDEEFPILRTCLSNPFAGFSVVSYLYEDNGFPEIVERGDDEGSSYGSAFGDSYEIDDFGDDGFGMIAFQGDSGFPVSVNPASYDYDDCGGSITVTDPTNPEFPVTHSIVDVCFGDVFVFVPQADGSVENVERVGFRGLVAENATFTILPDEAGNIQFDYSGNSFGGFAQTGTRTDTADTLQVSATIDGHPDGSYAGQSRAFELTIDQNLVGDCP